MILPRFNEHSFIARLESNGLPPQLQYDGACTLARWTRVYSSFINGPHFRPWFRRKLQACHAEIASLRRKLRIDTRADDLVRDNAPKLHKLMCEQIEGRVPIPKREIMSLVHLAEQITLEISEETDQIQIDVMRDHLSRVKECIPKKMKS